MDTHEVKNKAIRGVIALTWRTLFLQVISFVAFFLLGIFLSPGAIGVFIAVSALMRMFSLFTDLGLGAALVQKHDDLDDHDLSTTFILQTILVGTVVIAGLLLTPIISKYSHLDSDGTFLYQVLILTLLISSFKAIPSILLERKLAFEKQIVPQIVEALVFNILIVILAYKGLGVAAYSWSILASSLIGLPIYYLISPWMPSLKVDWSRARKLVSYGLSYQGKSVLAVFKDDLLTFFMSGLVGSSGIGYWGWAQRWSYFPLRFTVDSVTKVTFPAYSRIQNDNNKLSIAIEKSLFAVSGILFPILTLMALLLPHFIELIPRYGKWGPAVISFYFLCGSAALSSMSNILVNTLDATGRVKTTLGLMVFWIVATWSLTLLGVAKFGFTGISIATFVVSCTIVVTIYLVKRVIQFNFLRSIYRQVISCVIMGLVAWQMNSVLPASYLSLIIVGLCGVIIYVVLMLILGKKQILEDLAVIKRVYIP